MGIKIGILNPNGLELSAQRALDSLVTALGQQNIRAHFCLYTDQIPKADLLIGTYQKSPLLRELVEQGQVPLPPLPEAILIQELTVGEQTALWACAYDTRGLLYVLYELMERIKAQSVPALYKPVREEPAFKLRGILHFLPPEELKTGWKIRRDYWQSYFDMLIQNRFNCFTVVFNPASAGPLFPYLLTVPEHSEVKLFDPARELQTTNLQALKELAALAREAGLSFHLGFWNFYSGQARLSFHIPGLNQENIGDYLHRALKQLLFACPEINGLEFKFQTPPQTDFVLNTVLQAILETGNTVDLKLYNSQLNPDLLDLLQVSEVKAFLTTESWGGNYGLPYLGPEGGEEASSPASGSKLRLTFQLTTPSLYPWGDPDYFQTLFPVLLNSGYDSFQLLAPGSRGGKITPVLPLTTEPFVQWEFERHWYQFHLAGRLSYQPGTTGEVLIRDFHRRFGQKGDNLAELYRLTGKVLPLYQTVHGGSTILPELNTGGLLAYYLRTPAGDPTLFASCLEYAKALLGQGELTKISPPAVAEELNQLGREIRQTVQVLQGLSLHTGEIYTLEWEQTLAQAEILGCFALFHSAKLQAATELAFFLETKDPSCLEKALAGLKEACLYWEKLPFTARSPHSRLLLLEDEKRLRLLLEEYRKRGAFLVGFDFGGLPATPQGSPGGKVFPDYYIEEGFTFLPAQAAYDPEIGYGWLKTADLQATPAPLVRLSEEDLLWMKETGTNQFYPYENQLLTKLVWSRVPASFQVDLTPGSYQIQLTLGDRSPQARRHGPMSITLNGRTIAEDLVISPNKRVDLCENVEVTDGKLILTFACPPDQDWFISALTIRPVAPVIRHLPLHRWTREEPLTVQATVTGPNPIGQVILNYQTEEERGYHMIMMTPIGADTYSATIPMAYLEEGNIINYYITALDKQGKEGSLGSFEKPFSVPVRKAGFSLPALFHFPPSPPEESQSLTLKCTLRPATEVETVTLYYKIDEKNENHVTMVKENADNDYRIELDAEQLPPGSILKYRFVVKMNSGDLAFFPDPLTSAPYFVLRNGALNP